MADYTALEVGTTGTEEIAKCPYCGKNGLVEVNNGMTFYLHTKGEGMKKIASLLVGLLLTAGVAQANPTDISQHV